MASRDPQLAEQEEGLVEKEVPSAGSSSATRAGRAVLAGLAAGLLLALAAAVAAAVASAPAAEHPVAAGPGPQGLLGERATGLAAFRRRAGAKQTGLEGLAAALTRRSGGQVPELRALGEKEPKLSGECKTAFKKQMEKKLKKTAKLSAAALKACIEDATSDGCKDAQSKLEDFGEEFKAQCKASGDHCTESETKSGGSITETEEFCIPAVCHDEIKAVVESAKKTARRNMKKACKICNVTLECGAPQFSESAEFE